MSTTINNAVNQVLTRINEAGNSPIAELPTGTGPSASPTITTANQVVAFLNEGLQDLVKRQRLRVWGSGTLASVTAGTRVVSYADLTIAPTNFTMWQAREVYWNDGVTDTRLEFVGPSWYEVSLYNMPIQANAVPTYWGHDVGGVLLYAAPTTGGTLKTNGYLFFPVYAAGDTISNRFPDEAAPALEAYACWKVAEKNLNTPGLPPFAQAYKAEYERLIENGFS